MKRLSRTSRHLREVAGEFGDRLEVAIAQRVLMDGPKSQAGYEQIRKLIALRETWEEIEQYAEAADDRRRTLRKGGKP